jgi:hypothetical protein
MNAIKGLGEEVDESIIVQTVLIFLPMIFDPNILALEEREDLSMISMGELHGIFTTYEMRTVQENPSMEEETFKASRRTKKKKKIESKPNFSCSDDSDGDEKIYNFVRKFKKRTDNYKGMLPLKCFNCGKIGHFSNKCPYAKKSDSDEEEDPKKEKKYQKGNKKDKRKVFKKNIYSREDSSSSDENDESDNESERERVLLWLRENKKNNEEG